MKIKAIRSGNKYSLVKAHRPKFSSHRGATWDFFRIKIDGKEVKVHYDSTWGLYGYLELNGKWYKIRLLPLDEDDLDIGMFVLDKLKKAV